MIKVVAVAVDGSPSSLAASKWAEQAFAEETEILAIDIKDPRLFYHRQAEGAVQHTPYVDEADFSTKWAARAREVGDEVHGEAPRAQWHTVDETYNHSQPAAAFYDYALQQHAEILIVGRHHGTMLVEGLFGSFPRWLMTHADLPVIVISPHSDTAEIT
jgi:nucleotide-binding universal stress UspA family protein